MYQDIPKEAQIQLSFHNLTYPTYLRQLTHLRFLHLKDATMVNKNVQAMLRMPLYNIKKAKQS